MNKLEKENLFIEINDNKFLVAIGEYDEELNFKIIDRETFSPSGFKNLHGQSRRYQWKWYSSQILCIDLDSGDDFDFNI